MKQHNSIARKDVPPEKSLVIRHMTNIRGLAPKRNFANRFDLKCLITIHEPASCFSELELDLDLEVVEGGADKPWWGL